MKTAHGQSPADLPPGVRDFLIGSAILTALSLAYTLLMRLVLHRGPPYNWPLFDPARRFGDFTIYQSKFAFYHTVSFFAVGYPFTYPAPMAVIYHLLFALWPRAALSGYLSITLFAFVFATAAFTWSTLRSGLKPLSCILLGVMVFFLSWPAAIVLDRANVESFVWIAVAAGVWAMAHRRDYLASSCFGIAASLKLFPFLLLLLFLRKGKLKELATGVAAYGVVTLCSLALLGPTVAVAYHGIAVGLAFFHDQYMMVFLPEASGYDHSLLGFLKMGLTLLRPATSEGLIRSVARVYLPLMAVLGTLLYFLRIRTLPLLNQLLALTTIAILFTPFSGDGTLLHLYPGFALCVFLAIRAQRAQQTIRALRAVFWCFACLFSVLSFGVVHGLRCEAQIRCVALVILLALTLCFPFGKNSPLSDEPASAIDLS